MRNIFYKGVTNLGSWFSKLAKEEAEKGTRPEGDQTTITKTIDLSLESFKDFTRDVNNPNYSFAKCFTGKGFDNCLEIRGEHFPMFSVLLVRDEENNLLVSTKQTYFEPRARKIWG